MGVGASARGGAGGRPGPFRRRGSRRGRRVGLGSAPSAPHPAAPTPARRRLQGAGRGLAGQVLYGGSVRTAVSWPVSQASGRPQSSRCQQMPVDGSRWQSGQGHRDPQASGHLVLALLAVRPMLSSLGLPRPSPWVRLTTAFGGEIRPDAVGAKSPSLGDVSSRLPDHDRADSRPMGPETPRSSGLVSVTRQTRSSPSPP